jgi:hypothetical protein
LLATSTDDAARMDVGRDRRDNYAEMRVRRRGLLKLAAALPVMPTAFACAGPSAGLFFDDGERAKLAQLVDLVLPPDSASPGASGLGAIAFIDALVSGDGLYFASGPFSGRTPFVDERGDATTNFPPDDFAFAEPLDRVQREALRQLLFGGGAGDQQTVGLRKLFRDGLAKVTSTTTLDDLDETFRDTLIDLVGDACFGPPEYGGNTDGLGWEFIHYEGDQMPVGWSSFDTVAGVYKEREGAFVSRDDGKPDPEPIDDEVATLLTTAVTLLGGKDTKKP